jgi:carbon-monoxide dehydrogenase medium subunit
LRDFEYHEPATVEEASVLLTELLSAVPIAGGTDLIPLMKHEEISPRNLVSLSRIAALRNIEIRDGRLVLGAGTTLAALIESAEIRRAAPVLSQTAAQMASAQVRNLATIGGNIANSSPSADTPPSLIVLGARFVLDNGGSTREVEADAFFTGPGENILEKGEIVREIVIPLRGDSFRATYAKHTVKKGLEIAIVGVALSVELEGEKRVGKARIALGAVAPIPLRVKAAEEMLAGEKLTESAVAKAAALAREAARPIDDVRGSRWYRSEMVEILVKRGLSAIARSVA